MPSFSLPADYPERVYAGVLGKMIGVYLGRPFEGWTYERVMKELGEITSYVNDKFNLPLIVTDDDLAGTFTFVRALADYGYIRELTPAQIGQTWLNYIIEGRTILWWGGLGNSTEHTAYLRLKQGISAPESGSIALNGNVVAEQIGAQIFIDGWAMVLPGDPAQAADFARRAGSVSHDGEAIYAAQVLAAMEARAFVEHDINALLDVGISFIPRDSVVYRMIQDIRAWHAIEPDWRKTRERIAIQYGYDLYGGNCHVIPNHALIILALLYGDDDFSKSLMIVSTSGWDTDCNAGNVGCLLGIKNGLRGLEGAVDWRGPLADRLYLSTADGGRAITDAVTETYQLVAAGHALADAPFEPPKHGARFHFSLPGSIQGFQVETEDGSPGTITLENTAAPDHKFGSRYLAITYCDLEQATPLRVTTPTFILPGTDTMPTYTLMASPTLYSGQTVQAMLIADQHNSAAIKGRLFLRAYDKHDQLITVQGPETMLDPGEKQTLVWRVPDTAGMPIAKIGIELAGSQKTPGTVYLDTLTWSGPPDVTLAHSTATMWQRAWINGVDQCELTRSEPYRLIQNRGRGMLLYGTREWTDYRVSTTLTPHMAQAVGLGARVQGMQRYYALMLSQTGQARLIKMLDGEQVLAELPLIWELDRSYAVSLQVVGQHIQAWIDGQRVFAEDDHEHALSSGSIALICQEGRMASDVVTVRPV
ncbi:MAG TPA: ADP-ribosylglycohydrolase family protein [Ktedonobacteraceae bacterium]|nr:ADP-ribosylglycohydrolase family protein [Ktedonobacteraceae bacterium]